MGGTDKPSNLVKLTVEEHAQAHLKLYQQYGKKEDLVAYKCLMGYLTKQEIIREICSLGGKKQGDRNRDSGHMKSIQNLSDCVSAGKKGGAETIRLQKGAFGDPNERRKVASLGGKVQGKINGENGHCKKIAQQYWDKVKNGEIVRQSRIWITNGVENKMIPSEEKIDDGWRNGKTQAKKI
jgi:hypothetical protein